MYDILKDKYKINEIKNEIKVSNSIYVIWQYIKHLMRFTPTGYLYKCNTAVQ